jgi:hypothetical protein
MPVQVEPQFAPDVLHAPVSVIRRSLRHGRIRELDGRRLPLVSLNPAQVLQQRTALAGIALLAEASRAEKVELKTTAFPQRLTPSTSYL